MAKELVHNYHVGNSYIGFVYAASCGTYMMVCMVYPFTLEKFPRKLLFVVGICGVGACNLFNTLSEKVLGVPSESKYILIG